MFQKNWDIGNKRLGKFKTSQKHLLEGEQVK